MYLWQFAFDDSELSFLDDEVRFVHIPSLSICYVVCLVVYQCRCRLGYAWHYKKSCLVMVQNYHSFLVHLGRRLKCTIVIMRCLSSIHPLSVRPLSVCPMSFVVSFSHFLLLLWNHWTEFNKTWQETRYQRPLPSLCFSGWSEKQDGHLGLWLAETFFTSSLKLLKGI